MNDNYICDNHIIALLHSFIDRNEICLINKKTLNLRVELGLAMLVELVVGLEQLVLEPARQKKKRKFKLDRSRLKGSFHKYRMSVL